MGKEQNASYYNEIYNKSSEYNKPWNQSRYIVLWNAVLAELDLKKPIVDIGCGPGQFATMLLDKGAVDYIGFDFSSTAISIAKGKNYNHPEASFHCKDIFSVSFDSQEETQFVCMETLEHINKDLEFLTELKSQNPGKKLIVTVPTFDDAGHARYFKNAEDWKKRFASVLTITKTQTVGPWILIVATL